MEKEFIQDLGLDGLDDDQDITMEDLTTTIEGVPPITTLKTIVGEESSTSESVADKTNLDKEPLVDVNASPDDGNDRLPELYSSLATHFKKEGVLPSLNDDIEIKSVEDIQKAIQTEIDNAKSESQRMYEESQKEGVPKDSIVAYQQQKQQLDAITDEVLEADDDRAINLRFNIIAQDYLNKGFSKEEASKHAKRSVDLGEDLSDSKVALGRLKESNETTFETSKATAIAEVEKSQSDIKKFIESKDEIFKGIKLNTTIKDKLYNQMINTVSSESNKPLNEYAKAYNEDPVKFQVMQNYMYMLTKGYTDFSKITNAAATSVSREIDDVLKTTGNTFMQNGSFTQQDDKNSTFSFGEDFDIDS